MAQLYSALTMYRRMFGHSCPSDEIKTATLMGEREALRSRIVKALSTGEPVKSWAERDPYAHEKAQGGFLED